MYDSDEGDGLGGGYITKYMSIGNMGELMPQMWENENDNYFANYSYVQDRNSDNKSLLYVGSSADNIDSPAVGFGYFNASHNLSYALADLGYRCFNIIKDDGTVI